ncbi:MarR family winged helix-turn-helix transcriptional regulator [Oryzibacter oryziterrae]|uniref:MarR family winged helix-turn-helix transcriptional regulator n=1 Tax=Oryzibacter oryziterrae TaxID=2766474 RepID=UPI001F010627|nr:MarR family transcriptional regulator [Oryzibacter oryziterrae]
MPLSNKLAALALAISDASISTSDDLAPTAIAALISIKNSEPLSIGDIATVTGLTHSAAVRLVDRLEKDWLVRRQRRVGREVLVEITTRGRRRAQQLQEARESAAKTFLSALEQREQDQLAELIDKVIHQKAHEGLNVLRFCRMCKVGQCNCGLHQDEAPATDHA